MRDDLDDARALLPGVRLEHLDSLGGGDRSDVCRARAEWPGHPETTVIVKQFVSAGEGWVRETAALTIVPPESPTARVVVAGAAPPIVIMSDLGDGANVADALLGDDAEIAADSVALWAQTMATLHRTTLGSRDVFRAALDARCGDMAVSDTTMFAAVDDATRLLEDRCWQLDLSIPSGALAELRELPRRLNGDSAAAISPNDACPDNNVRIGDTLALIDFEGAQWRHVAWDVAYLNVPWPSCWCSWRMPGDVTERAFERYRMTIEDELPYVRTQDFRHDVAAASVGWSMLSTAWFLPHALGDDPPPSDPVRLTPTRRAMILHRLDRARRSEELPLVAELAELMRRALVERWGEVALSFAPAFAAET